MAPLILSPELLIALAGLITAFAAVASQWRAGIITARKDEVSLLHDEIARLQDRVKSLEGDLEKERRNRMTLQDYVAVLRALLIQAGIKLPEIPKLE
jgi:hypothetical protein